MIFDEAASSPRMNGAAPQRRSSHGESRRATTPLATQCVFAISVLCSGLRSIAVSHFTAIHEFLTPVENLVEDKAASAGGRVLSATCPLCPRSDAHSTSRKIKGLAHM